MQEDLIIYTSITDFKEKHLLTALLDNDGTYSMPSLSINENTKELFYADSHIWIIEKLHPFLYRWTEKILTPSDFDFIKSEINDIDSEDYELIYDLINKGIKLGFFQKYYLEKNS